MTSIFISYSRKDIEFARQVVDALAEQDLDTWIDWQSIPKGEDWKEEIDRGIEQAETFIFLMSPDSAKSAICNLEVAHALKNNKRVIPIVIRDTNPKDFHSENSGKEISKRNWVFCRDQTDDFDVAIRDTIETIHTDYEWVKYHTKLQVRALEWERNNQERSLLYRGKELENAELQLATNSSKDPVPTDLQHNFVLISRQVTDRQRRVTFGIAIAGVIALAGLAVFGFVQANNASNQAATAQAVSTVAIANEVTAIANAEEAQRQADIARAGELAALALTEQNKHFDLALLFGLEGLYAQETLRARGTLLSLTNSHPGLDMFLSGHRGPVNSIAFSPNGEILASGGTGNNIILWDFSNPSDPSQIASLVPTLEGNILSNVLSISFSPDGKILAAGYSDFNFILETSIPVDTIILWDIGDPTSPSQLAGIEGNGYPVNSVAFSPNGETLASGRDDGIITLWDISDPATPSQLTAFEGNQYSSVFDIVFSPDGELLASGYWDLGVVDVNTVILWDVRDLTRPAQLAILDGHDGSVGSVAFSPDGEMLATGSSDNSVILWDISNPRFPSELATLEGHNGSVSNVAFHQTRKILASGSSDNSVILWDINEPGVQSQLTRLEGHSRGVNTIAFSPDLETLASGSDDNTIVLWKFNNLTTPAQLDTLKGRGSIVYSIVFRSDGEIMVSGGNDNSATLWDFSNSTNPFQLASLEGSIFRERFLISSVHSVAISPDGKTLAIGHSDLINTNDDDKPFNVVILWDISNPRSPSELAMLEGHIDSVSTVAFSPDGKTLASGSWDDTIILWDISNPSSPFQLAILEGHEGFIKSVAISPDGQTLASGGASGTIILWDVRDPTAPYQIATLDGHGILSYVNSVAFSPDGETLASGSDDNTIIFWDIKNLTTPIQLSTLEVGDNVNSVAFSPDGNTLASGSDDDTINFDNTIILWNISDLTAPSQLVTLEGSGGLVNINSVGFSPSGKTLATGTDDGTIILWDMDPTSWVKKACQRVGRNFTRAEWAYYFPTETYRKTCEQWSLEPEP